MPSAPTPPPPQARAALENARSEALPHWRRLIDQYPRSPRLPQALYHAGVLHTEGAKPDPERSAAAFEQLTKQFPASPWTGDAHVRLIDVKLERQFDLPAAALHARAAADWLETIDPEAIARAQRALAERPSVSPLPPGEGLGVRASADGIRQSAVEPDAAALPPLRRTRYDIYLRAGLVAYLSERPAEAVEWFERAKPFEPDRTFVVVHGHIPTGIERLIEAAKSGKSLTPEEARQGDERARLILMLADVYHEGENWEKSLALLENMASRTERSLTSAQLSYAHFRRARNYYARDDGEFDFRAAFAAYANSVRTSPKSPWADEAMFKAANILWNHKRDADGAIGLWRRLIRANPTSDEAGRAAYFVGVIYEWSDRPKEAVAAYEYFLRAYPGSRFTAAARQNKHELEKDPRTSAPGRQHLAPGAAN